MSFIWLKAKEKLDKAKATSKNYQAAHQALPVNYKMGTVGAVALDNKGNISLPFNTSGMYRASKSNTQATYVAIFNDE